MANPTWPSPSPSPRRRRRGIVLGIIAVSLALVIGFFGGYQFFFHQGQIASLITPLRSAKTGTATQPIQGWVADTPNTAQDVGELSSAEQMSLSITLPLQNASQLQTFLNQVYTPGSPHYHQFLTPAEFQARYAPPAYLVRQAKDLLIQSGFTVSPTSSWQFLTVQAPVTTIERVFHVQLHHYTVTSSDGVAQSYFGPAGNPKLDGVLAGLVQNVTGLDNFQASFTGPILPNQANAAFTGYTPQQLQKAYGADTLLNQNVTGAGQNIALVELANYTLADITHYQSQYNLTGGTISNVTVDNGAPLGGGSIEVELDMEIAAAMAPGANQLIYLGPNSTKGLNDIYSQIVNDNQAKIVSTSWGLCEAQTGTAEIQTLHQIFQQGAAQGIAFFAAAGDSGAYDCNNTSLAVDSPADDPYVTGVGGTSLTLASDGTYGSEVAWQCTTAQCKKRSPEGAGGGGGLSAYFGVPTYQQGLAPPGTTLKARYVPDISANADPQTGYAIYCSVTAAGCNGDMVVGGTSAAAPLWAAGAALISQYLSQQPTQPTLGNLNPTLYPLAQANGSILHDVTQGKNIFYPAGKNYDLATGLGTPQFGAIASALAGTPGTQPGPTPTPVTQPTATVGANPTSTPTVSAPPTATPSPTAVTQPPTGNPVDLIDNGGFENGMAPWVESSSGNYYLIDSAYPHSGSYSVDFCGYSNCLDSIGQQFQVPTKFTSISLSYYWNLVTNKATSSCLDSLTVTLYALNADGTLGSAVTQIQQSCNSNAITSYKQQTADVTSALQPYTGQQLALIFSCQTDGNSSTSRMFIDDVSLQAR